MFTLCLLASIVTIVVYLSVRSRLVRRLNVFNPASTSKHADPSVAGPLVLGITISDALLDQFDDKPAATEIRRYVLILRVCTVLLVLIWIAGVFSLA